jgi:hypothetical protein
MCPEATMNKPKLQPECVTASETACLAAAGTVEIVEVRNVTLKEALEMVRVLADRARSKEIYSQQEP